MQKDKKKEAGASSEGLLVRRLDNLCPPLKRYLHSGANVLDLGCGPGIIAIDVAREVNPGEVTGVDGIEVRVDEAKEIASEKKVVNVSFEVGDAHSLRFNDDTFDISYCTHLLEWVNDPVKVLKEMRRVVKPGGWVVAGMIDVGTTIIYPKCPSIEHFFRSLSLLEDWKDDENFLNWAVGREAFKLFSQAELSSVEVDVYRASHFTAMAGDPESVERWYNRGKKWLNPERPEFKSLERLGVVDQALVDEALKELDRWRADPHASWLISNILGAGRA